MAEKRGLTVDTDLRPGAFSGLEPGNRLRVQLAYDLREALHTIGLKIRASVQPLQAARAARRRIDRRIVESYDMTP